jgi:hypothetical protein
MVVFEPGPAPAAAPLGPLDRPPRYIIPHISAIAMMARMMKKTKLRLLMFSRPELKQTGDINLRCSRRKRRWKRKEENKEKGRSL